MVDHRPLPFHYVYEIIMFILVSYDVPDDKRRLKMAKLLLDYGGERVQKSVFECYIIQRNFDRLQERIRKVYNEKEDSVRFYFLCDGCRPKALYLGVAKPIDEPGLIIL